MLKINRNTCLCLSLTTALCFLPISVTVSATEGQSITLASAVSKNRQPARSNVVTGTVTYRQRIALPPGAVISIKLLDVSRQDAAAQIMSEQIIRTTGQQVPIPFKLKFDPAKIRVNHSYVVRAEIRIKGKLAFTTTKSYPVITNNYPIKVDLVLEQVNEQSSESESIIGEWLLEDLAGAGVLDNLQTTIKFTNEGRLAGFGGCNNYFAAYQIQGNKIKIGVIGSTQKSCTPAIMDQEFRYFQALGKAYRIRLDKNRGFLLIDSQGFKKPLKFTRISAKS